MGQVRDGPLLRLLHDSGMHIPPLNAWTAVCGLLGVQGGVLHPSTVAPKHAYTLTIPHLPTRRRVPAGADSDSAELRGLELAADEDDDVADVAASQPQQAAAAMPFPPELMATFLAAAGLDPRMVRARLPAPPPPPPPCDLAPQNAAGRPPAGRPPAAGSSAIR
jgi:hypothetical protein